MTPESIYHRGTVHTHIQYELGERVTENTRNLYVLGDFKQLLYNSYLIEAAFLTK